MYVDFITKIFRCSNPKLFSKFPILVTLINLGPLCSYSCGRILLAQSVMQITEFPLSRFTMKTHADSLVMRPAGWTNLFLTTQGDKYYLARSIIPPLSSEVQKLDSIFPYIRLILSFMVLS